MNVCLSKRVSLPACLVLCSLSGNVVQGEIVVSAVVNSEFINTLQFPQVTVDVFVSSDGELDDNFVGYQINLYTSCCVSGHLEVFTNLIDVNHPDSVFIPNPNEWLDTTELNWPLPPACAIRSGTEPVSVQNPGYLGTFRLSAPPDAHGEFQIGVLPDNFLDGTVLLDANSVHLEFSTAPPVSIFANVACLDDTHCTQSGTPYCLQGATLGENRCVACLNDGHCEDGDDCTAEVCEQIFNVCQPNGFEPSGTPCEDQLFCTRSDTCDGAGSCVGTGPSCVNPPNVDCCESANTCYDSNTEFCASWPGG